MSRPPKTDVTSATTSSMRPGWRTSRTSPTASPPADWISLTTVSTPSTYWSVTATRAPSSANRCAVARPMPDAAPVTSAAFPAIDRLSLLSRAMVARRYGEPVSQAIPQPAILLDAEFATELLLIPPGRSAAVVPGPPDSLDPPLAEIGAQQAAALASRLALKPLAAVYASDLKRALDTAAPIAADRDFEITVDADLREVNLGDWERGEYRRRAAARDPEWIEHSRSGRWDTVPGSEGDDAFRQRVMAALGRAIEAHEGGSIAVVCHGGVINAVIASIWNAHRSFLVPTENTGITVVRAGAGRHIVVTVNDCHHLYDPVLGVAA